jgi:murein DD-endopeptidase MepM/ murein hydrolase activator NlpD
MFLQRPLHYRCAPVLRHKIFAALILVLMPCGAFAEQGQGGYKLPVPAFYQVKDGDTLYSIARTFDLNVAQLTAINNLPKNAKVRVGQKIKMQGASEPEIKTAVAAVSSTTEKPFSAVVTKWAEQSADRFSADKISAHKQQEKPAAAVTQNDMFQPRAVPPPVIILNSKRPNFVWPVRGKVISMYGAKGGGLQNDGINIAAPKGTPVTSAADGIIAYVGDDLKSYGNLILIRHSGGLITAYAHMASVTVKKGMPVRKGQPIGSVGSSGTVATSQLHFEIRQGAKTYDPKQYLG